MSDLNHAATDQRAAPTSRFRPGNRPWRDLNFARSDHAIVLLLVVACVPPPERRGEVHRPELWVDAFSISGGDGSESRAFRSLPSPLPAGALIHVRAGVYRGPFQLGDGVRLEGQGAVVLTRDGEGPVVTADHAELDGLSIQGGTVGLQAGKAVVASRLHVSGQRETAVRVEGELTLRDSELVASVEGIGGLLVERDASASLEGIRLSGGFKRALRVEGGRLVAKRVQAVGTQTVVSAQDAEISLDDLEARAGTGPAVFVAGGKATVHALEVEGHEYGLEVSRDAQVTASDVHVSGTAQACISSVNATLSLKGAQLGRCGLTGALVLFESHSTVDQLTITKTEELGVLIRKGTLTLTAATISGIGGSGGSMGDAVHARDATVRLEHLTTADLEGSALFASALAEVTAADVEVARARQAALFVEHGAHVVMEKLDVQGGGGPAVLVPDSAVVKVGRLTVKGGSEAPVYAECGEGAQVELGQLTSNLALVPSRCVTVRPK